jgi:hypothetical protein
LRSIVDLQDASEVFISSTLSQNLLLEVVDIYLAHIYDKHIKASLVLSLAAEANSLFESVGQG